MEITNNTLAWFVVAAIAVSIIGTSISLSALGKSGVTGYAATSNTTGNASVYVSSLTNLRFSVGQLSFGSGYVNTSNGAVNCTLTANDSVSGTMARENTSSCEGFSTTAWPLVLENAGNTYLNVTLNFSVDNSSFPGGNAAVRSLKFQANDNESGSCRPGFGPYYTSWTEVTANSKMSICGNLSWDTSDTLKIGLRVVIPSDASGQKDINIYAQGEAN